MIAFKHIFFCVGLVLVLATGQAHAEKVWTKSETSLRADPDDASSRVARIQGDRELSVIEKKGNWYRVKVGVKTGWIRRSDLRERPSSNSATAESSSESAARATGSGGGSGARANKNNKSNKNNRRKRRSRRNCREGSAWCDSDGDAMRVVVVVNRVEAYKEPRDDEDIAFLASQDQELVVLGHHSPDWMYVQTLDGKLGWIHDDTVRQKGNLVSARGTAIDAPRTQGSGTESGSDGDTGAETGTGADDAALSASASASASAAGDATRVTARRGEGESLEPEGPSRFDVRLSMGAGAALSGRALTATSGEAGNYETRSTGLVTSLAGDIRYELSGPWHVGVDGNFALVSGLAGLEYNPAAAGSVEAGNYLHHRTELSAQVGYETDSWNSYLHVGGAVGIFYIQDLFNEAALPRERLLSPLVGINADFALSPSFELGVRADALVLGALAQTRGREDGTFSSMLAVAAQAEGTYSLSDTLGLLAAFRFDRVFPEWTGASVREAGVEGAARTDQMLRFLVGVQARFQ
ncbi:SH3 domain-containing protein [Haliangium ochraceum]|uniref:SH3 domain-containing protein n=1 Tax=Haliangium ochraceum (strain DSM 14365 / JCM 11303 / SMP-2) TaxID=502025 RepID=D0LYZ0_HALO1|nr:SH3 domain-containing protein [Haliangium ochraceum]ACY14460.1 protein of unknown function DUF1058 [Haliangium ochraceum DSM 14365]